MSRKTWTIAFLVFLKFSSFSSSKEERNFWNSFLSRLFGGCETLLRRSLACPVASSPLWFILLSYPPSYIITPFSRGANRISSSLETRQGIKVHVARVHRWEYEKNGVKTVRQERRREKDGTHISRDGGRSFARKGWWSSGRTLKLYILISAQCSLAHKPISFFTLSLLRFRIWLSSSFYYFVQPRSRSRPLSYPAPSSFCFLSLLRMDDR